MAIPGWVTDPAEFIRAVHSVWGKHDKEELRRELAALRGEIDKMRPPKAEPEPQFVSEAELTPIEAIPADEPEEPKEIAVVQPQPQRAEIIDIEVRQLLTQLASLSQLTQITKKLAKEEFQGQLDPRTLDTTDRLKWLDLLEEWPHKAWISGYFINDGPNTAEIAINRWPEKRHLIKINETLTINQEHADERIEKLFYKCDTGETASVRAVGQY